jgi:diguanylate cyclase (GGDEF)-like protein/PAS domain S-box-containing protein
MSPLTAHAERKPAHGTPLPTAARPVSSTLWRWFLALEAVFALIYFPFGFPSGPHLILGFLPWMEWPGQVPAWAMLGLSAVAAIAYGIRRNRPNARMAWWFLCGGVLLFIAGDTTYKFWHQIMGQQNIPFPSFIDAIYITMYPVLAVGLLLLARARVPGGDRASLLDALTLTLGVGLLSWIFLIGPSVRAPGETTLAHLVAAGYPLGDILVLAMLAHLWGSGGLRNTAGRLLAIGAVGTLVSDTLYGLGNLASNWHDGNPLDLGWMLFYACWGAAALHPSMRTLSEPRPAAPPRTSRARLMMLAAVSLIAPGVLLVEAARGNTVDAPVIAVVAGAMFLLVLVRMAGLVQAHQHAMTRERVLRTAAAELVAAPGNAGIYEATMTAVSALVSGHSDLRGVTFAVSSPDGGLTVVAQSGEAAADKLLSLMTLRADVRETLNEGKVTRCAVEATLEAADPAEQESTEQMLICPLLAKDQLQGLIAVTSASLLPVDLTNTIETLAVQVGLALDREALTATFHARRSEARFQTLVQNASDIILIARPDTTITYQTPSAQTILGYEPGSLEGERFTTLLHPDDVEQALAVYTAVAFRAGTPVTAQWRVQHRSGSWCHVEVVANNLLSDPTVEGIVLTMRDVSERKSLEEELKHQAFHDALSGLANRALFTDRLEHASARAARSRTSLAVLFLDLDDFKLVNDSLGHAAGDEMLVEVAERLIRSLRVGDTAARFGGDEFAVLLEETSGPDEACRLAERIIEELRAPMKIADREIQIRASVGIALSAAGAEAPGDLLQAADVAMYAAKGRGKGRYEVYHPALQVAITERLEWSAELQRAVDNREFVVYYQPIVSLDGDKTVGVEALVRWRHPERGLLLPAEFISLAEETGLIIPLGRWVLREACQQARQWQLSHPLASRLRLSVNISARHFQHDGLVEDVSSALELAGLDAEHLVLEITESVLVQDADAVVARMLALKLLGVSFAIDDFGTGYSSLSYLKRFPIDILKVDKSFVDGVGESPENGALAEAIVQLGNTLHLETVAEGIEEARQVEGLRALGCQFGQGFYFAKALPADEIDDLLTLQSTSELSAASAILSQESLT